MAVIISTDCDSPTTRKCHNRSGELPGKAARLRHKSKQGLMSVRGADATKKVERKPSGIEAELSLLQANFESGLEEGLKATIDAKSGIITIQIYGAGICGKCHCWTAQAICPACGNPVAIN